MAFYQLLLELFLKIGTKLIPKIQNRLQIIKKDPHLILKPIEPNVTPFHMPLV
jgi:hypothetical protein